MSEIASILKTGAEKKLFTAASALVLWQGKQFFQDARGVLDPCDPTRPAKTDSIFDLASLTKVFVATALRLVFLQEKISLDLRVGEIEPAFFGGGRGQVTFRHLLSHSSGLPASFNLYQKGEWRLGKATVMAKLLNTPLAYRPGTKVVYSCLGYMLLGYLLETICGQRLDQILAEVLFEPAGLSEIFFRPAENFRARIALTAFSRPNRGELLAGTVHDGNAIALDGGIAGNAGLFATADAVGRFGQLFLDGKFLSPETIKEMVSVQAEEGSERRGLGWRLWSDDENCSGSCFSPSAFGHTGYTGTSLWLDPASSVVCVLLTNSVLCYRNGYGPDQFNAFRLEFHRAVIKELGLKTQAPGKG